MRLKKNKIWTLSVLLIFLVFGVFLNNYYTEEDDFKYNSNKNFNDKFSNPPLSSTFWYNSDWQYCKTINITTGSAAVPSDYTVSLTFNHTSLVSVGKSRTDGNDIRVVYWNGSDWEELDRMLDPGSSWDNNSTRIWFKTQATIPASSFDSNYYLYYGNTLAGLPPTNSSNVFFFYDGFESGDLSAWDDIMEDSGDEISVIGSTVHTGNYAGRCYIDNGGAAYVKNNFSTLQSFHTTTWIYLPNNYSDSYYTSLIMYYSEFDHQTAALNIYEPPDAMKPYIANFMGPGFYFSDEPISKNEWHRLEIKIIISNISGRAELWIDGINKVNETNIDLGTESIVNNNIGIFYRSSEETTIYIDDSFDKLWVDPEPTTTLSTEKMFKPSINDFNYYKEITIDHTKVSGSSDHINFPVLISIFDSDLHDHAQPDGDDIAFYNGSEWIDYEIELFNQDFNITHAQMVAWVRIPLLSISNDTKIYMYYGNSTIGPQENPAGVWDKNYVSVYHLNEVPTGIANDVFDSTFYGNDGLTKGSMNITNLVSSKVGMGLELDGFDDFINISKSSSLDSTNDGGTLSLWINWVNSSKTGMYQRIMTTSNRFNKEGPVHKDGFEWSVNGNGDTFFYPWGGDGDNYNLKTNPFTNGIWHQAILTFNYSSKNVTIYLDGSRLIFDTINVDTNWTQLAELEDWLWGASINVTQLGHFEGKFDEIRVSNITRSEDWIITEYNNQYDPNNFYSIGTENQVGEDISAPDITINLPNPDDLFGWSAPDYDLTVIDANLDSIWYTLNYGFTNSTPSTAESGTIDQTLWEAQGNGTATIRFYANDTLGNINYEEVIVRKDIIKPSISINSPSSGSNHSTPPSYSLSITEANLDEIWYSLDGGLNNYTGAMSGTIDSIAWGTADLGAVTITFYVNDTVGNWNSTSVGVTKTSDLSISINSPNTAEWFRTIPDYDIFVSGNDRDFIWYTLDNGLNNYTITSTANLSNTWSGIIDSTAWGNADQGSITIIFYLNNTFGNIVSDNVQINKDTIAPAIDSINSPLSGAWFNSTPPDYSLSINETNLEEIW
ncbi:MAG: DUF2341 domain-containing protein, partial [Promethearchaeota archaeon]